LALNIGKVPEINLGKPGWFQILFVLPRGGQIGDVLPWKVKNYAVN